MVRARGVAAVTDDVLEGRSLVPGRAAGEAVVSRVPLSFLGDIDIRSGTLLGESVGPGAAGAHEGEAGCGARTVAGRILVMPGSRGSAGAWRFLYQLYRHHTHPLGIVSAELPDPSVVQGAILAGIPVVCDLPLDALLAIEDGTALTIDGPRLRIGARALDRGR